MNTEDKIHAEKVLKNLFIGSQVDGLQFGISPGAIKIHFTNFHDSVYYECWQAGVLCEEWLVVAAPGNEIATWAPDEFTDK